MIYYLRLPDKTIKIGHTNCLLRRFSEHQKQTASSFKVLGYHEGGAATERCIHSIFSEFRMGRKERFRPEPKLMEWITRRCKPWNPTEIKEDVDRYTSIHFWGEPVDWLEEAAEFAGLSVGLFIDKAIAAYAKGVGFNKPSPTELGLGKRRKGKAVRNDGPSLFGDDVA